MVDVSDMLGTWTLVSWTSMKNGVPAGYPMGEDAHGQIIYSAEGRMAASLMRQDFKDNPSTTNPTPDVCLAYGGPFHIEGDELYFFYVVRGKGIFKCCDIHRNLRDRKLRVRPHMLRVIRVQVL